MKWKNNLDQTQYWVSHYGIKYELIKEIQGGWKIIISPRKIFWIVPEKSFETFGDWKERAIFICENYAKQRNWLNLWWKNFDSLSDDLKLLIPLL